MSVFFCDSNCELWFDVADTLGVNLIRMPYTIDGKEYFYDLGRETDFSDYFGRMRKGSVPITSALNEQDYIEYFEPVFAKGEDILYVSFSTAMSGTFEQMEKALVELKKRYPDRKLTRFDTKKISMGAGLIVYQAAKMHKEGKSDEEIIAFLTDFQKRARIMFTVQDLVYLKRGGRISGAAAMIGSLLSIKPILHINDAGLVEKFASAKGMNSAIKFMLDLAEKNGVDMNYPVAFLNAGELEAAETLKSGFIERFGTPPIMFSQSIGPVIGAHCGPGTIGLVYIKKA